jgi:hypothetical protein
MIAMSPPRGIYLTIKIRLGLIRLARPRITVLHLLEHEPAVPCRHENGYRLRLAGNPAERREREHAQPP